ncbi:MAG: PEPxxWA-CTERM sorting domain-containing protein [Pseudomonadota bacterium]
MQLKAYMTAAAVAGGIALSLGATSQAGAVALTDLTVVTPCSFGDISPAAIGCRGFYDGNLLNNSGNNKQYQQLALAELGFTWDGTTIIEEDTNTDAGGTLPFLGQIDFANNLNGTFYFGIHFGAGQGSPGRDKGPVTCNSQGKNCKASDLDTTAFYKVNGGAGLDFINLVYNSGSTARLYGVVPNQTDPCVQNPTAPGCSGTGNSVPEPGAWALMIMGFGAAGSMLRRRRAMVA